jgi:hypothetical protein
VTIAARHALRLDRARGVILARLDRVRRVPLARFDRARSVTLRFTRP